MNADPHPLIPPGVPGWAWAWCAERGISLYHPERWPADRRAEYELLSGEAAPIRSPYIVPCPCHPQRLGLGDRPDPWRGAAGAADWLRREFGR
jgi:hypothetical protein